MSDLDESRDRDTLPPDNSETDVLISMAEKLDAVAVSLTEVARTLSSVARDLSVVQATQQSHGKAIGSLTDWVQRIESRLGEVESAQHRRAERFEDNFPVTERDPRG